MSRHAVPAAILIGACIIAAALYLGLRQRPVTSPGSPPPTSSPVRPPVATRDQVAAQVEAALEAQRARFVASCWVPSATKTADPARSPYSFNLTVGPDGNEITRGITELRGQSRVDVARCLRDIVDAPVKISPPGEAVTITVTLWLPR